MFAMPPLIKVKREYVDVRCEFDTASTTVVNYRIYLPTTEDLEKDGYDDIQEWLEDKGYDTVEEWATNEYQREGDREEINCYSSDTNEIIKRVQTGVEEE